MLEAYFVQTCQIVETTRNIYSDRAYSSGVTTKCRFRTISTLRRDSHSEIADADSMIWLPANTVVDRGSIVLFESRYYQVERITPARKLGSTIIEFIKCDLKVIGIS